MAATVQRQQYELAEQLTDLSLTHQNLERANRSLQAMLSRVSHELKTPLHAVMGFTQLLLHDRQDLTEDHADMVSEIHSASQHLLSMIEDLLEYERLLQVEQPETLMPVAVFDSLKQAISIIRPLANERAIQVEFNIDDPDACVLGAHKPLLNCFLNVLSNAVKYNRNGGQVSITVDSREAALVHIIVTDNGIGIPADKLTAIFEPFNRAGAELTNTEGTGLGLAITRQQLERMGGRIRIRSHPEPTPGTRCRITLRKALAASSATPANRGAVTISNRR